MMGDLVSIVVPIFNMENSLRRCIDSILDQNYKNIEIILVDDGSVDNSPEICKRYADDYTNIKVILQENRGVSRARNRGIEVAKGEWIMFVDPDDFLQTSILDKLLESCEKNKDIDIAICSCIAVDADIQLPCHFYSNDRLFSSFEEKKDLYKQLMLMSYGQNSEKIITAIGVPWGRIYRRELILHAGLEFNPKLRRNQDNIFNIAAFSEARNIIYIDYPLYMYSYSHMATYFSKYNRNHAELFTAVRKEKYDCLKKYGLLKDSELYSFYLNEAIIGQANIIKYGIFPKENNESLKTKLEKVGQLSKLECFAVYMRYHDFFKISSLKYKFFWLLIKFRLYFFVYIISQL